jgi:potassium efflux system protein
MYNRNMYKILKITSSFLFILIFLVPHSGTAQFRKRRFHSKRDSLRAAILSRDSLMMDFRKSDTSISSLLKKIEEYTSSYNEIKSSLMAGLDTNQISAGLPQFEKRTVTIKSLINNDQSSTLRYLYAIRDFLTHSDDQLDTWQLQLKDMNDKLLQNEDDLQELYKDTSLKKGPSDASLRGNFDAQRDTLEKNWHALDNVNKKLFIKIGNLQNRVTVVYIAILDETNTINLKIANFSIRAFSNEYGYLWNLQTAPGSSFKTALAKTLTMNEKLFGFFADRDTFIHLAGLLLFILFYSWIYSTRRKITRVRSDPESILSQSNYIVKYPLLSAIIITFTIAPNFYDHPPTVFLETLFIVLIIAIIILVKKTFSKPFFNFLLGLFLITIFYSISNLFIVVSDVDRIVILVISAICIFVSASFLPFIRKNPDDFLPYSNIILQIFIGLQSLSLLNVVAAILWLIMLSQNLNIEDAADTYISNFLSQTHQLGSTGTAFTFQSIIIFIAVIWLSSLAAKIISYLYDIAGQHDIAVLKKKNRTSTLLIRIAVFAIGFFLAVAASGFPLDKITIIISAFGIGIGFGLQNIVNNLVSGLILAFEKPVQIGDIIQVDGNSGTIREIGIRSSRIATGDGAEVIIPNGDLISHHVINWTLSNNNRRVELIVGVAYGSDIDKVKKILKDLLANRDDVMTDPAPLVFLHNLNESSVDFRLLFWAADISTWLELKSRILAAIYSTFNSEGIDIPFPVQDVHVYLKDQHITVDTIEIPAEKPGDEKSLNKNPPDPAS